MNGSNNQYQNGGESDVWVYHERQEAALCGQHALNNLLQCPAFSADQLSFLAHQLDELELNTFRDKNGGTNNQDYQRRLAEGSGNVDAAGNFSIQVLKAALQQQYQVDLPCLTNEHLQSKNKDITSYDGFLCHKDNHWFAIRHVGGRFWNLNSMEAFPLPVGHFRLAQDLQGWRTQGYPVCVVTVLPYVDGSRQRITVPNASFHKMSDLLKGKATGKDPWESLQGAGRRLDGGARSAPSTQSNSLSSIEHLTEDEQVALALSASIADVQEQEFKQTSNVALASVPVPPEPSAGTPGAVRIQLKLPGGRKLVRRFMTTDTVNGVEACCRQKLQEERPVQILSGFPPKPLDGFLTIEQAELANQSVQVRFAS